MKDRDKLIELLTGHYMNTMAEVNEVADHLLANGVVKVVRCKDCKHYKEVTREWSCFHPKQEYGYNSEGGECLEMKPDDFCSYGELKELGK